MKGMFIMKKKIVSIFIALTLVMSQAVIFAASANTWVDDSSYPGGGYWMDDEGYIINGSGRAPAPGINLVTGDDEPQYSASPAVNSKSGAATFGTVTAIVSSDPSAVQFYVNTDGDIYFEFYLKDQVHPEYTFENGLLTVYGASERYTVDLYSSSGTYFNSAQAINEHNYSITYNLDGNKVTVFNGTLSMGDTPSYTAPIMFAKDNVEYELIGGENSATQIFSYGKANYEFIYQAYKPEDLTASVESVDERGNRLDYISQTVKYRGGDVIFNLPKLIEKDGRSYIKVDNTSKITVNYYSPVLNYTVKYKEAQPVSTQPYSVKVNYVDSETGKSIGGSFFNVTAQNIVDEATVQFTVPEEIAYYTGDSTVYYRTDTGSVQHNAMDSETREYTVQFSKMAEDAPYTWSVRLVDIATGNTLDTKNYPVTVSSAASHATEPQIVVNGIPYVMDSSMQNEYVHNYGDEGRIQYIYYNAEGTQGAAAYDIKVRYVEIGGNTELFSESHSVQPGQTAEIPTDENYRSPDGTQYVRLQGQGDIDHSFFSTQRTYSVYYRDINDVQNADTVVVREEVINVGTTEEPETTPESSTEPTDNTEPVVNAPVAPAVEGQGDRTTVITNGNGDTELVDDEGVPMADRAQEEIENSGAPLAGNAEKSESTSVTPEQKQDTNWILILSIAAVFMVIAAAVTVFIYTRRKKNS